MADVMHQGSCLCGGVCFILHGEPEKVFICYCRDCQKNAGGPGQIVRYLCLSVIVNMIYYEKTLLTTWCTVCKGA